MSLIQKIRDKYAGVVIAFIALSLIAFILMDAFSGRGGGSLFGNSTTLGKVNGAKIDKRDFDRKSELTKKAYNMGEASTGQMNNRMWDMSVDNLILQDECEKVGLAFTDKELNTVLFGNTPPEWMRQFFTDPATGEYKADQAAEYFRQLKRKKNFTEIEQIINDVYVPVGTIEQSLRQKYMALITNSVYVPQWLAEKQLADANAMASVAYVHVPYSSLTDSLFKVTDDEINAYVKDHATQYKVEEETRNISYVTFDLVPSTKDTADALQQVMQNRDEFASTNAAAMGSFLERAGSVAGFDSSYNSKDAIQSTFKDTLVKQPIGAVYGPFVESSLYILAKITGQRTLPDSVKCRHILLGTADRQGNPLYPDSIAKAKADSVAAAIRGGASFDALEERYSTDDVAGKDKGVMTFPTSQIQGQGFAPEFAKFILYDGKPGDKKVVKTSFGYHYIEVMEHKNPKPHYQIAYLAKPIQPSQPTIDEAMSQAQRFAGSSRNQKEYTANLDKFKKQSFQSAEIRRNDFEIQGLGESRELVRWVYDSDPGDVSDKVFDLQDKFIVPMVTVVQKKGLMTAAKARPMVEHLIRNEKKAQKIIAEKFKGDNLESYAQSSGYTIARADSLSFSSSFVAPMGMEPKLVGVAFNRSMVNKVTGPIAGSTGVFAARVEPQGARASGGTAEDMRKTLEGQMRSRSGYESFNALKRAASIKDYRDEFY